MLCPLLPGIADSAEQIDALICFAVECGCEKIFAEPVNARGNGLIKTQQTLEAAGYTEEAAAIAAIRNQARWSNYVVRMIRNLQQAVRQHADLTKLRILLYPSRLLANDVATLQSDIAGIIWL